MPDGSIRYSQKGQTIFSLISKKQAELPPRRTVPKTPVERAAYQKEVRSKLRRLLRYQKSNQPLNVRQTVVTPRKGYKIEKIQFLSEPGIYVPAWVFIPEGKTGVLPTILYVGDEGVGSEGMEFGPEDSGLARGLLDTLVRAGNLVVAIDVRGIGETRPSHGPTHPECGEFQLFDLETALAYMAWYMDQSLLGMRVQDVVRSVDYIMSRDDTDKKNLRVIGKGMGGLWSLYAAALDSRIRSLISVRSLLSYGSLTQVDRYVHGADIFAPDILLQLDLPQVAAVIAGRPLALIRPTDAMKKPVGKVPAQEAYSWTQAAYDAAGLRTSFRIETEEENLETPEHYLKLIRQFDTLSRNSSGD
jgi:pimeloyl-ACP methyl ester carboxylesterase